MRRLAVLASALALLCAPIRPLGAVAQQSAIPTGQERTLANGLRVVVIEDHAAPVAQIQIWYRFGALDETPGKTGLAHALEHMMFRGTHDISSAGIDDMSARLGADVNAETENEMTHFYFVVPADRVDTIVHFEADRMRGLALDPAAWNLERGAVLEEYAEKHGNPVTSFIYEVNQRVYPGSRLGGTSLGVKADIERATVADLRRYYDEWYHPNNATLVVAGDVHASDVFAEAERWFGAIPSVKLPARRQYVLAPASGATWTDRADYPYTMVDEAYAAPGDAKPYENDQVRNDVALNALFDDRGPFRAALVDSGLTLGVEPEPLEDRRASVVHVLLLVAPGHTAAEVRAVYERTMTAALKSGLEPELFDAAKRSALASMTYARDSIVGIGTAIGANMVFPGDTPPSQFYALYGAITRDQATAVARRVYAKASVVAVLQPTTADPAKFRAAAGVTSSVTDDFAARTSTGPLVQPDWMRVALGKPLSLHSTVDPVTMTLPNGLRLYVQRVATNPTVFIDGVIRRSPAFDPPGKEGLGELTSALMDFGSAKYDYTAQRKVMDDRTAQISFGTTFAAHGRAADFATLLAVLSDDVRHPLFPADKFQLVRSQLSGFTGRRALQAGFEAQQVFNAALYPPGDPALRVATAGLAERDHARRRALLPGELSAARSDRARRRRRHRSGRSGKSRHGRVRRLDRHRAASRPASSAAPAAARAKAHDPDRDGRRHRAAWFDGAGAFVARLRPAGLGQRHLRWQRFVRVAAVPRSAREARPGLQRRERARSQPRPRDLHDRLLRHPLEGRRSRQPRAQRAQAHAERGRQRRRARAR
jgi:zinc protease